MTKIYTKTGDRGETGLYGGSRVKKASQRVQAYGAVDQSNASIGVAVNFMKDEMLKKVLRVVQDKLFVVGGELASDEKGRALLKTLIGDKDIRFLEGVIDEIIKNLPEKNYFVIPGKTLGSAFLHVARTQVRFAEREILLLMEEEEVREALLQYMNRLSDTLYAMSRYEDEVLGEEDAPLEEKKSVSPFSGTLTADLAGLLLSEAKKASECIGVPMVISIVDEGGNLKAMERMDGAILGSIEISRNKAYTAALFSMDTDKLGALTGPKEDLYGIEHSHGGRVVSFAGGLPLFLHGKLIGAIGVSGGTVEEDKNVCKKAVEMLKG